MIDSVPPLWLSDAVVDLLYVPIIAGLVFVAFLAVALVRRWWRRDSRPPLEAAIHRALTRSKENER